MSEESMRAEFEYWASRHYYLSELSTLLGEDGYAEPEMAYAWDAWKASRATLVIELPKQYGIGGLACDAHDRAVSWCGEAIESAGVRVKE